jgi:hypothetical protein
MQILKVMDKELNKDKVVITKIDDDTAQVTSYRDGQKYTMNLLVFTEEELKITFDILKKMDSQTIFAK